jgi:hypothetical protein
VAASSQTDDRVETVLIRLNAHMLGGVLAVLFGVGLCLATWILLWQGGARTGQMLGLLSHLLPGFAVSPGGAIAGGIGAGLLGYAIGLGVGLAYGPWLLRGAGGSTFASEGRAGGPGGVLLSLRPLPLALVSAALLAVALVLVTTWLWWRYGGHASPHLDLLVHYLPGYSSDPLGALVGAVTLAGYGFVAAFSVAWLYGAIARLRAR